MSIAVKMAPHHGVVAAIMAALACAIVLPVIAAPTKSVMAAGDPVYVKECGACHIAYSPELLPSRSWKRVMSNLGDHFGESAQLDPSTQQRITDYLAAHSADTASNEQSLEIMKSLKATDTPTRITEVPYIAGLHTAAIEPIRGGNPRPHTLAECGVCHYRVDAGNYTDRRYSVTDEGWRSQVPAAR